jgi:hypothetical protein
MKKLLVLLLLLVFSAFSLPAFAHEGREVGDYVIVFGWRVEPAYAGVVNGPEFWVTEHDTNAPVEGLEYTLNLTVHFGDQSKELTVYPAWSDPGHYTADLLPTRPGDYSFHMTGTIADTQVDEMFTSADGEFSPIEPSTDIEFPTPEADIASLQAQIDELRAQIEALSSE